MHLSLCLGMSYSKLCSPLLSSLWRCALACMVTKLPLATKVLPSTRIYAKQHAKTHESFGMHVHLAWTSSWGTDALCSVQLEACDSPAGRLGLTVCYDLRFPEVYQRLAFDLGAKVLLVPSAFTKATGAGCAADCSPRIGSSVELRMEGDVPCIHAGLGCPCMHPPNLTWLMCIATGMSCCAGILTMRVPYMAG